MTEIFAFFAGIATMNLIYWVLLFGLVSATMKFDVVSVFCAIIAAGFAIFIFQFSLLNTISCIVAYIIIGTFWSFWRYKRYVQEIVCDVNENQTGYFNNIMMGDAKPLKMTGKIVSWILSWPFSMIENVIGDIIQIARNYVTETLKSVYEKIYESAIKNVNIPTKKD